MAPGFVKVPGANHDSDRTGVLGDEELCMDSFGRPVHRERGVVCEREQSFEGFEVAFERAEAAAGDLGVDIAGGASTVRQAFAAGVIDELMLDVAPVLLGAGERLFDGVQDPGLQPVEVIHSPRATHVRYRIGR